MPAIERVLNGFRLFKGEMANQLIDICNNLSGFGTPQVVTMSGEIFLQTALTTNGAIAPGTPATYVITKAGVLADTLAAPVATTDDGKIITITSATANAHTLTATGLLQTGAGANANLATFAAQPGAGLTLMAYQAKWYVLASVGITFS
jgi:hypothetical protein